MLHEGNAINFVHGAALGDFISLVQGELLVATHHLLTNAINPNQKELDKAMRDKICKIWLSTFKMTKQ